MEGVPMIGDIEAFFALTAVEQINFLKNEEFSQLDRQEKIRFLKAVLRDEVPARTTACALRLLRELNYPDRYYFRKFLYHIDSAVATAARQAISEWCVGSDRKCASFIKVLQEGKSDDRMLLADYFLQEKGKLNENVLISFLSIDDGKVREHIVKELDGQYDVDESVLSETITKGAAWYVRAALVEILGNRKSKHLFDSIEYLLKDSNVEVKLKLIDALLKFEMEKRIAYLQKLTADSLIWVRKRANKALTTV
jgi:HEAT repeat protein